MDQAGDPRRSADAPHISRRTDATAPSASFSTRSTSRSTIAFTGASAERENGGFSEMIYINWK